MLGSGVEPVFLAPTRSELLHKLEELLDAQAPGAGTSVAVVGPPGIGKSTMLEHVASSARARGWLVVCGRADELSGGEPFAAILDLVDRSDRSELADVSEVVRRPPLVGDLTYAVTLQFIDAFERLAPLVPGILMVVDDAHWADAASLAVLRLLVRRVADHPVVLVMATRPHAARPNLASMLDDVSALGHVVEVAGLDEQSSVEFAVELLGLDTRPDLRARVAPCGGNPFYIAEVCKAMVDSPTDTAGSGSDDALRAAVMGNLASLGSSVISTLQSAAIIGSRFSLSALADVVGSSTVALLDHLSNARAAGFIVDQGAQLSFRHDLVRDALLSGLSADDRRRMHRAAALAMRAGGAPIIDVALQFGLGSSVGDLDAIRALRQAATAAAARSTKVALELMEMAIALCPDGDPISDEIEADTLLPLLMSERPDIVEVRATHLLARSAALHVRVLASLALSDVLATRGHPQPGIEMLDSVVRNVGLSRADIVLCYSALADLAMRANDPDAALVYADVVMTTAVPGEDDFMVGTAVAAAVQALLARGRVREAQLRLGLTSTSEDSGGWGRLDEATSPLGATPQLTTAILAMELDDLGTARAMHVRNSADHDLSGNTNLVETDAAFLIGLDYLSGAFDLASAEAEAFVAASSREFSYLAGMPLTILSRIALHRGELDAAREFLDRARTQYEITGPMIGIDLLWWLDALLAERDGDLGRAVEVLSVGWELIAPIRYLLSYRFLAPDLVRLLSVGAPDQAARVAGEVAAVVADHPAASARGVGRLCVGLATHDRTVLDEAMSLYRVGPRRVELLSAAWYSALALGRRDGKVLAVEAAQLAHDLGADGDRAMIDREFRLTPPPSRAARPTFGWDSLTPAESAVNDLLSTGLTNRQIALALGISPRTVESHLQHTYVKLGISTRVDLALQVAARRDH